jgi:16S rRNA (guanine966-N2)-methyltransferase
LPAALGSVQGPFDIVFMDPPYGDETAIETLSRTPSLVAADGSIVFEHASRYDPPERPAGLRLADRRVYGDSALAFYRPEEGV